MRRQVTWPIKTKDFRIRATNDRYAGLLELVRIHGAISHILQSYDLKQQYCSVCGRKIKNAGRPAPHRKLGKLINQYGKEKARKMWREERRQRRQQSSPTFALKLVTGGKIHIPVCSADCRDVVREQYERTKECKELIEGGRLQLKALRKFLRTGNPEVFLSLPTEYGPAETSPE